jgi:hypothetical protein
MLLQRLTLLGRRLGFVMLLCLSLAACLTTETVGIRADTSPKVITDVACKSFKPIGWSTKDTRQTQNEVTEHNAVYKEICNK